LVLDQPAPGHLRAPVRRRPDRADAGAELLRAVVGGTRALTLDLSAVTHLASAGVSVLHEADTRIITNGAELRLLAPPGSVAQQILALVKLPHTTEPPEEQRDEPPN
jgi:anti-anti-sigma regulatory factor